jgi:hypothetical protein
MCDAPTPREGETPREEPEEQKKEETPEENKTKTAEVVQDGPQIVPKLDIKPALAV